MLSATGPVSSPTPVDVEKGNEFIFCPSIDENPPASNAFGQGQAGASGYTKAIACVLL